MLTAEEFHARELAIQRMIIGAETNAEVEAAIDEFKMLDVPAAAMSGALVRIGLTLEARLPVTDTGLGRP